MLERALRVRGLLPAALLAALALLPSTATADCGDDIGGARVACRCGDVVVTDATLLPQDPVVVERCTGDALIVRAHAGIESLHLSLGGQTLLGSGSGVGVRVLDGGSTGAVVVGGSPDQPGAIVGFDTGLRSVAHGALAGVSDLIVRGNEHDGLVVRGTDTIVENVVSDGNGRDGIKLSGRGVDARSVRSSDNRRYGVRATGRNVAGDVAAPDNGRAAAAVSSGARAHLHLLEVAP
jgi:hypothetical protein